LSCALGKEESAHGRRKEPDGGGRLFLMGVRAGWRAASSSDLRGKAVPILEIVFVF